jgi:hypothetical protein
MFCVVDASLFCDVDRYRTPISADCMGSLSQDMAIRFFVDQQMRTFAPPAVWDQFLDTRPPQSQEKIVQLPKWISYGALSLVVIVLATIRVATGYAELVLKVGNRHL